MNEERWQNIVAMIQDQFTVHEHETTELDETPGSVETIVFNGPMGKMKIERVSKPKVDDVRTIGSKRIGGDVTVQKIYSKDTTVDTTTFYVEKDGEWTEVDAGTLGI